MNVYFLDFTIYFYFLPCFVYVLLGFVHFLSCHFELLEHFWFNSFEPFQFFDLIRLPMWSLWARSRTRTRAWNVAIFWHGFSTGWSKWRTVTCTVLKSDRRLKKKWNKIKKIHLNIWLVFSQLPSILILIRVWINL